MIALVNSERAAAGCGPLKEDAQLRTAAQGHSDDMAQRDYFSHTDPDGGDPGKRTTAAGYRWSTYGENIAMGQQTAQQVMDAWMKSQGHRENILNCSFKDIGVGIHQGSRRTVVDAELRSPDVIPALLSPCAAHRNAPH